MNWDRIRSVLYALVSKLSNSPLFQTVSVFANLDHSIRHTLNAVEAFMRKSSILLTIATMPFLIIAPVGMREAAAQVTHDQENPLLKFRGLVAACERSDAVSKIECC